MAWRVELFGGPRLVAKSRESISHFPTQKTAAILAYLAITLPRSHSREVIAELFWPDKDPALARNSLSVTLSGLRKLLGESLVSGRLQVGLNPETVTTDVTEFEARLKAGDVAGAAHLARAELLPGFYDDWVVLERERLVACLETASAARPPHPDPLHNLPEPLVSFIGRDRERRELVELTKKARLVTLTGSGGSGKTQLSQYVARDIMERFKGGVFLVELAPVADPTLVVATVASSLGVKEVAGSPILTTLLTFLHEKKALLVLDNCEHLLEASATLAQALLQSCPALQILATSREALGIGGEHVYRIPSLALDDAIRLFVERAVQHRPGFAQTEENAPALAALCTRLDGIPLAIELAAARLRSLSLEELHRKLSQSFALLTSSSRTALPRHQTLRGLIDWSYHLLLEDEKTLLCRLSVFAGGWSLEAAEQVCSSEEIPESAVLDTLTSLVDKSLVLVDSEHHGATRYRLLETVRQYAHERLQERDAEAVQARHLAYFRDFCQASYPRQHQASAVAELNQVEQEHDNIRVALQFGTTSPDEALQRKALETAGLLRRFWYMNSHLREARQWYRVVLALPVAQAPSDAQGECLIGAAMLARTWGDHEEAETLYLQCIAEQKALGNDRNVGIALGYLGALAGEARGDKQGAVAFLRESLSFAQKANDLNGIAQATINIGITLLGVGDALEAEKMLEKGLQLARRQGNRSLIAGALGNLGLLACERGEYLRACALGRENLAICQEFGRNISLAVAFNYLGLFTQGAGELKVSRHYREESLLLAQQLNGPMLCVVVLGDLAELDRLEGNYLRAAKLLGAAVALQEKLEVNFADRAERPAQLRAAFDDVLAFDQAFEEGSHLTLAEASALATSSRI